MLWEFLLRFFNIYISIFLFKTKCVFFSEFFSSHLWLLKKKFLVVGPLKIVISFPIIFDHYSFWVITIPETFLTASNTHLFYEHALLDPGPDEDYKKKTRRNRTTFSNSQLAALEKVKEPDYFQQLPAARTREGKGTGLLSATPSWPH